MTEGTEEVRDAQALLTAYNNLKEEIRKISDERDALSKEKEELEQSVKQDTWRLRALQAEIKAGLTAKGLKDAEGLMEFVGTEGMDFDKDGKLTGLDERLAHLEKKLPAVFNPMARVGGKGDIAPANPSEGNEDPMRDAIRHAMGKK